VDGHFSPTHLQFPRLGLTRHLRAATPYLCGSDWIVPTDGPTHCPHLRLPDPHVHTAPDLALRVVANDQFVEPSDVASITQRGVTGVSPYPARWRYWPDEGATTATAPHRDWLVDGPSASPTAQHYSCGGNVTHGTIYRAFAYHDVGLVVRFVPSPIVVSEHHLLRRYRTPSPGRATPWTVPTTPSGQ